jgi:hypothetical protein
MKEHMKVIPPSAQRLIDIVSSISGEDITKKSRRPAVVAARSIYYKILRDHEEWSLVRTGAPLNKDHATVKHGIATLDHFLSIEKNLNEMYRRCLNLYVNNEDAMDPISRTEVDERISKLDNRILDLNSYIADLKAENSTLKKELSMYSDFTSMLKLMVPPSKMGAAIKKTRAVLNGL